MSFTQLPLPVSVFHASRHTHALADIRYVDHGPQVIATQCPPSFATQEQEWPKTGHLHHTGQIRQEDKEGRGRDHDDDRCTVRNLAIPIFSVTNRSFPPPSPFPTTHDHTHVQFPPTRDQSTRHVTPTYPRPTTQQPINPAPSQHPQYTIMPPDE